jgi:hypothetical protein
MNRYAGCDKEGSIWHSSRFNAWNIIGDIGASLNNHDLGSQIAAASGDLARGE